MRGVSGWEGMSPETGPPYSIPACPTCHASSPDTSTPLRPEDLAAADARRVHHAIAVKPVVVGDRFEQRVGAVAEVHAIQLARDRTRLDDGLAVCLVPGRRKVALEEGAALALVALGHDVIHVADHWAARVWEGRGERGDGKGGAG
eukprot:358714-Chlamydomonas_euryale.AAC.4